MVEPKGRQAGVEITPEMLAAGVAALQAWQAGTAWWEEGAVAIYSAMASLSSKTAYNLPRIEPTP